MTEQNEHARTTGNVRGSEQPNNTNTPIGVCSGVRSELVRRGAHLRRAVPKTQPKRNVTQWT
jgi:hypothetical protein